MVDALFETVIYTHHVANFTNSSIVNAPATYELYWQITQNVFSINALYSVFSAKELYLSL